MVWRTRRTLAEHWRGLRCWWAGGCAARGPPVGCRVGGGGAPAVPEGGIALPTSNWLWADWVERELFGDAAGFGDDGGGGVGVPWEIEDWKHLAAKGDEEGRADGGGGGGADGRTTLLIRQGGVAILLPTWTANKVRMVEDIQSILTSNGGSEQFTTDKV